ncbi:MAG: GAF domain-containing protein [Bacteroidales bacterium]|nr:GAF domain-containing protein [Bacteroidales bacterium]MDY0217273.1 GAF domain-containing protein [Bacteroidales bacterium]
MTETLKTGRYNRIYEQLIELFVKTDSQEAHMATAIALLHNKMDYFFWTGFYFLRDGELTIGNYQGSLACLVLKKNTGVCWAAINQQKTIIVDDVDQFEGHIACDGRSESEIVVPIKNKSGEIIGVLDVDSRSKKSFSNADAVGLEKIINLIFQP